MYENPINGHAVVRKTVRTPEYFREV